MYEIYLKTAPKIHNQLSAKNLNHVTTLPCPSPLKIYPPRASSIIVHRVQPDRVDTFLQWERAITSAASLFPGYQVTEAYPPANPELQEWVVLMHFDDAKTLESWLNSTQRADWMAKLPPESRNFQVKTLPSGLGEFLLKPPAEKRNLPHWKSFLAVLFALYPTVMLLNFFLAPHLKPLGLPLAMLISNAASVAFLEYLAMPFLSKALAPWLQANEPKDRPLSFLGLTLLLTALSLMAYTFNLFS